ncbi:conjugal transfer protein TraD [Clostridium estertheticum]|uniref:conjugal transfer protein TraD n=1 Tax=Clostridium estertheticum TaxID=238834 RepID=UPI001C0C9805|nr:conjugal transfer protein TraD [Clostridium estertheticum]MBU3174573.1 conjugal transfer protein TraD [Clostridium estertheticum]
MAIKNGEQRIEELSEKIKKLEAQKKQLEVRTREQDRKARTRKLIQIGGILNTLGIDTIEKAELLKNNITNNSKAKEWFEKLFTENKKVENKEIEELKTV